MSFQRVKPTKPELNRLKNKENLSIRGKNLLELKREQLQNDLKKKLDNFFKLRGKLRNNLFECGEHLKLTYEAIGTRKVHQISVLNQSTLEPTVDVEYSHRNGLMAVTSLPR